MAGNAPRIIPLEEGWEKEIRANVSAQIGWVDGNLCRGEFASAAQKRIQHKRSLAAVDSLSLSHLVVNLILIASAQAIDKLEEMLNGGMKGGRTNLFGPREYVNIYTYVSCSGGWRP